MPMNVNVVPTLPDHVFPTLSSRPMLSQHSLCASNVGGDGVPKDVDVVPTLTAQ